MRSAFPHWLERTSHGDRMVAGLILYNMLKENQASDNLVWDLLRRTGDESYTAETFMKAAEIALANDLIEEEVE